MALEEIHRLSREKIEALRARLGPRCQIGVENLNYYDTGAYDDVCEPEFYNDICESCNVRLVLDIAHAQISAWNMNQDFNRYLSRFSPSLISEIHISKIGYADDQTAVDQHDPPEDSEFGVLYELLANIIEPVDVVIEFYMDPRKLMDAYKGLGQYDEYAHAQSTNHS